MNLKVCQLLHYSPAYVERLLLSATKDMVSQDRWSLVDRFSYNTENYIVLPGIYGLARLVVSHGSVPRQFVSTEQIILLYTVNYSKLQ